jgi:hypothetical protein
MAAHLISIGVTGDTPWHALRLSHEESRARRTDGERPAAGEDRRPTDRSERLRHGRDDNAREHG